MLGNSRGQSLIQLLVAVGVSSIVVVTMMTMMTNQQRDFQSLTEKIASAETARVTSATLTNLNLFCNGLFLTNNLVNPSDISFDATNLSPTTPKVILLKKIPSLNFEAGAPPSNLSHSLKLNSSTASLPGIRLLVTSKSQATLQLNFDQSSVVQTVRNQEFPGLMLMTSGPTNATQIDGCGNAASVPGSSAVWTTAYNGFGPGREFFNVTFTPKRNDSWVNIRVDVPVVAGQGGIAALDLYVNGAAAAQAFHQFGNLAYHSSPMTLTHWFQPGSTDPINISVRMAGSNGTLNQPPATVLVTLGLTLSVTENLVH